MKLRFVHLLFPVLLLAGIAFAQVPVRPLAPPAPVAPGGAAAPAAKPAPPTPEELAKLQKRMKNRKLIDEFFAGPIVRLEIEFSPEEWAKLNKDHREYAEATITEVGPDAKKTTYKKVAIKLKGAAGSFQPPDQRPGLTVNMGKFKGSDRFHGMKKFHLNNGAQDGSLLNEFLSGEMCRAAAVPASRCTHVALKWQGREMGIYIFKETFNEDFFSYFFEKVDGSLYDGHFICEIDGNLEKQEGDPEDTRDIKGLAEACKEPDEKVRWQKISERLDVAEFLRFFAMETYTSHWDGYNFNKNNYRVYFDSKTGKASFFAHGMDQTWGIANWSVLREPISLVGTAVLSNPAWKAQYRKVTEEIYTRIFNSREWDARLQRQGRKVQDAMSKWVSPQAAKDFQGQINGMRDRVKARIEAISKQFPKPLDSNATIISLAPRGWHGDGGGTLDEVNEDGQKAYHIQSDGKIPASWKCGIILPAGKYRFQARVKVAGVEGRIENGADSMGQGAGLRINGSSRAGKCEVKGSASWQAVSFDFETPGGEVVFLAELNSGKGDAWFARNSFALSKLR